MNEWIKILKSFRSMELRSLIAHFIMMHSDVLYVDCMWRITFISSGFRDDRFRFEDWWCAWLFVWVWYAQPLPPHFKTNIKCLWSALVHAIGAALAGPVRWTFH
jgi:hypothetical protein